MAAPNFGKRNAIVFGNLMVSDEGGHVQLSLLTEHKGQPYALFTKRELPGLIKILQGAAKAPPPTTEADDDNDWSDLV